MTAPTSALKVGAVVELTTHRVEGRIVEVLSGQRYRVALGSIYIVVKASHLTEIPGQSLQRGDPPATPVLMANRTSKTPKVLDSIDLHGLLVDEASRLLEDWLNAMILSGGKRGRVIHGLGSGKVQRAAHGILSRYAAVSSFRINEANPGETIVYLG